VLNFATFIGLLKGEMTHQLCFATPRYFSRFFKGGNYDKSLPFIKSARPCLSATVRQRISGGEEKVRMDLLKSPLAPSATKIVGQMLL